MKKLFLFFLVATLGGAAFGQSSDGPANLPGGDIQIRPPEFSAADIEKKVSELRQTIPNPPAQPASFFDPGDQLAFNELQASVTYRISEIDARINDFKRAYIQGVAAYDHYGKYFDGQGMDEATRVRQIATVVRPYHDYLQTTYDSILEALDPRKQTPPLAYHMDAAGNVDTLADGDGNVIFGSAIDRKTVAKASVLEIAGDCKTAFCVFEIAKVANELGAASLAMNKKFKFQEESASGLHLFYDPQHSLLRRDFSNYMDREVTNHEQNVVVAAIEGLTDLGYITLLAPLDFIVNLRVIGTSFDFNPDYWSSRYDRNEITKDMPEEFSGIAGQKISGGIQ